METDQERALRDLAFDLEAEARLDQLIEQETSKGETENE